MTEVCITQSAWYTILKEVNYFASRGNHEASICTLFGFIRSSDCLKAPWEMLELGDLHSFVVTHAHAPLRKYCAHTAVHAEYVFSSQEELAEWNNEVSDWRNPLCEAFGTLEVGNAHSHPFSRFLTRPSMGMGMDYPRIYELWECMRPRMVNSPLEIILCRANLGNQKWKPNCFGFDASQKIVRFQNVYIVSDNDERVQSVLANSYWKTQEGVAWERKQQIQVPGLETIDRFHFGWSSARIRIGESRYLFIHLPPSFPRVTHVLAHMLDTTTGTWSAKGKFSTDAKGYELSFNDIIRNI